MELVINMIMEYIPAFAVGGAICLFAQLLIDKTALTPARILVGYVVAGVVLGALGLYEPIVAFADTGATVPISGFGYLMSCGVREAVESVGLLGALSGGLRVASAGISAAIAFGLGAALLFRGKRKK